MLNEAVSDNMLFGILNECGSYEKFLDVIFSFLFRRTCFFKSKKDGDCEKSGLPHGLAEKMVETICKKYLQLEAEKQNSIIPEPIYLQECREEIVETTEVETECTVSATCEATTNLLHNYAPQHVETLKVEPVPPKATDKDDTSVEKMYYASNPECYNGASYDTYCWSQTISDLDVQVKVPVCVKYGKQVKVHISHTHLKAEVLKDNDWEVLLDGQLCLKINNEGSTWTLDPGRHIHIHLEKPQQRFWEALMEGEPKINVRTIDCSKSYEDLCEEEQAKIQELMYDQHQKRLGKPTVKETKVHEILKEAWNKETSPFKGTKFDPSQFNVMG